MAQVACLAKLVAQRRHIGDGGLRELGPRHDLAGKRHDAHRRPVLAAVAAAEVDVPLRFEPLKDPPGCSDMHQQAGCQPGRRPRRHGKHLRGGRP